MFRLLSFALRAMALYITGAIMVGSARDPSLTWLHAVGLSAPTVGFCSFILFMFNQKPEPLDLRVVRKRARVPFFAFFGFVCFALAYVSLAVHPEEWEEMNALSAVHLLAHTYAGSWALAAAISIAGAMCLELAFRDTYLARYP
jgi:hypothetical protein